MEQSGKPKITSAVGKLGRVVVSRLGPGTDVLAALEEIVRREGIEYGVILGGAASLREVVLRNPRGYPPEFPITDQYRIFTALAGPLELLSLSGNISRKPDGTPVVHGHITISTGTPEALAFGGHLVRGAIVYSTGEVVVAEITGVRLLRRLDEETRGWELHPTPGKEGEQA